MVLDITAYRQLTPVENPALDEDGNPEDWENHFMPGASMEWSEKAFPGRGEGVDAKTVYSFADSFGFRAGSYSGYNSWRRELAKMAGVPEDVMFTERNGPFAELINFADNEGTIGPIVSAKLAKDFDAHLTEAEAIGGWFLEKYTDWQKAFTMASDNGAVSFH